MAKLMDEQGSDNQRFAGEIRRIVLPKKQRSAAEDFVLRKGIMPPVNQLHGANVKTLRKAGRQAPDFMV